MAPTLAPDGTPYNRPAARSAPGRPGRRLHIPGRGLARHVAGAGDLNYARLTDPVFEELLAGFATLLDPEERRQQALKVNARHAEVVPFIPLTQSHRLNAVNRRVRNDFPHFLPWVYEVHPDLWAAA